jgi:2-oxoglutarate ferredoxin oxidoreductase subunit delta
MPKVEVLKEFCKSCLYCIKVCPNKVLDVANEVNLKGYQYVRPVAPDACTGCALCATMCPDSAIEVYK